MNVVFDLGGVVFDWQPAALVAATLPRHAVQAEALAREIFQGFGGDWCDFDRGTVEPAVLADRIAARIGLPSEEIGAVIAAVPAALVPKRDTLAWIDELKAAGHRLFYLSNMPAPYADHLERSHAVFRHFEAGVFSGRVNEIKPEPAIFRRALARFGLAAGDCVFLDDHLPNIEAARAEGWRAIHFTDAAAARRALET